jgi:dTDP-glucose 4,6-dehydratase
VEDVVDGFLKVAETDRAIGQTINIGSSQEISIGDLAQKIIKLIGRNVKIVMDERRLRPERSEVHRLCADNHKARDLLNWSPRTSLDEGLLMTVDWISRHLERYRPLQYQI